MRNIYIGVCICAYMVKVISLSDEAYMKLKTLKRGKSFSEIVVELVEDKGDGKRKSINEFVGIWKDDDYWDNFKKEIRKLRTRAKLKEVRL